MSKPEYELAVNKIHQMQDLDSVIAVNVFRMSVFTIWLSVPLDFASISKPDFALF